MIYLIVGVTFIGGIAFGMWIQDVESSHLDCDDRFNQMRAELTSELNARDLEIMRLKGIP